MIVIGIIGILAAALFPSLNAYLQRAQDTAVSLNIKKMVDKINDYLINTNPTALFTDGCIPLKATDCSSLTPYLWYLWTSSIGNILDNSLLLSPWDFTNTPTDLIIPYPQFFSTYLDAPYTVGWPTDYENSPSDAAWVDLSLANLLLVGDGIVRTEPQYLIRWARPGYSDWQVWVSIALPDPSLYPVAHARCRPWIAVAIYGIPSGKDVGPFTLCTMRISN